MNAPLYAHDVFGYPVAMALATVIGLGFGFVLERAGFGRASILAAQFYGRDNRVLKVMFSAIVTTAVGLTLLGGLGVVELGALTIPGTWLGGAVVGGLLLGVGFVVAGYCPGTALVATGSGNVDGAYSLVGMMLGAIGFGVAWPWMEGLYDSGSMGVVTLPEYFGLSQSVVVAGVVVMAVGAFLGAEALERFFARKDGVPVPPSHGRLAVRNAVFAGFAVFAAVSMLPFGASPTPANATRTLTVHSMDLAQDLIERPSGQWIVDLRDPADCARERIPGALCLPADGDPGFLASLPPTRTLVLYGAGTLDAAPEGALAYDGTLAMLDGGWDRFRSDILSPPELPIGASPDTRARYDRAAALHGYFTGAEVQRAPPPKPKAVKRAVKKGGGC